MTCMTTTLRLPARRPGFLARLSDWCRTGAEAWRARRRARDAMRRLPPLDEHTLRDLGLARGELLSYWAEADGLVEATRLRVMLQLDRRLGI